MTNKSNKLSDMNYTWYDLGKPEKEGIFYQDFYNEKVMKIMREKFIDKKITIVRHGETEEIDGEKVLNHDGKENIKKLSVKILETIGTNKEINIHYSSKTKRIKETLEILEEILKSEGIKINYFDVDDLDSGGKKKNLGIEINSKTGKVGKYISNIGKNKFKKNFKMFIGDLFAKVFLNKKVDKKSFTNIVLGHSTFIPGLKTLKEKDFTEIHIKSDEINHGEGMAFDFQKGEIVQDNKNIIELNLENYKKVIDLLKDDENFENIIKKFENKKVDLKYLQNQMNFIFSKDKKLLQKYFILDNKSFDFKNDFEEKSSKISNFIDNNLLTQFNKLYDEEIIYDINYLLDILLKELYENNELRKEFYSKPYKFCGNELVKLGNNTVVKNNFIKLFGLINSILNNLNLEKNKDLSEKIKGLFNIYISVFPNDNNIIKKLESIGINYDYVGIKYNKDRTLDYIFEEYLKEFKLLFQKYNQLNFFEIDKNILNIILEKLKINNNEYEFIYSEIEKKTSIYFLNSLKNSE